MFEVIFHHSKSATLEEIKELHKSFTTFAEFLYYKRIKKDISQRDLAKKTGMCHTTISRYEGGIKKNPSIKSLIKLGLVLDFTLDDIKHFF